MKALLLLLLLTAAGNVLYHVGQKSIASDANPMVMLMAVYAMAFLLAGAAAPFFGGTATLAGQVLSWPVLLTAIGIVLIELGFLLVYRSGGSMQSAGAAVAGLAAVLLLPLSVLVFRESLSMTRTLGLALTLSGLILLGRH